MALHLTPAYGRDYKSKTQVTEAFNSGADFMAHPFNGPSQYTNKPDLVAMGEREVNIRYSNQRKVCVVKVQG